jgi:hypothetical protein
MTTPDIDGIFDIIQDEFNYLDQQIGSFSKRHMAITELPQLSRDLYLIHDIVAMTCNSGVGPWILHHHEEPGWISCSEEAFVNIGHPQVSTGIRSCFAICLAKRESMTSEDDKSPSDYIIDHEHEIMRSLYAYLLKNNYVFHNREV